MEMNWKTYPKKTMKGSVEVCGVCFETGRLMGFWLFERAIEGFSSRSKQLAIYFARFLEYLRSAASAL